MSNTPELVYLLGAISMIGAKANIFNEEFDKQYITEIIDGCNADIMFVEDGKYEELKEKIRLAETPKMASAIGRDRNNTLRENWEEIKRDIMLVGVMAKFRAHPDILKKLIDTGDEVILVDTGLPKETPETSPPLSFAKELAIARNTGIVGGIGDNKFAPKANIKRCDMMLMIYRVIGDKLPESDAPEYADFADVPEYAKEAWQNNFVMLSTWNEYGEGTYISPTTREDGFAYLDVIRDTYTKARYRRAI